MNCDCGGTVTHPKDGAECAHTPFLADPKVIDFLLRSAVDAVAQVVSPTTEAFANQSEAEIKNYEDNCLLLNNH